MAKRPNATPGAVSMSIPFWYVARLVPVFDLLIYEPFPFGEYHGAHLRYRGRSLKGGG